MTTQLEVRVNIGEIIRQLWEINVDTGRATGGTINTLIDTNKEWPVNAWANFAVEIVEGTGVGQFRQIASNTATALTVSSNWTTIPDATSRYRITPFGIIAGIVFADIQKWGGVVQTGADLTPVFQSLMKQYDIGTASAGGANSLTDASKSWDVDMWKDGYVRIYEGTGIGQARKISSNAANILTVTNAWAVQPNATSKYVIYTLESVISKIYSGDNHIGQVTVSSMPFLASGDQYIGQVTVVSGQVVITSGDITFYLLSGDNHIGHVTVCSMPYLASGDEHIGQVTISSLPPVTLTSANISVGDVQLLSGDEHIGHVTVCSMPYLASGNEHIGWVYIDNPYLPYISSGDEHIGQVTVSSICNLASGDEHIGQTTVSSFPYLASGDQLVGHFQIDGGGGIPGFPFTAMVAPINQPAWFNGGNALGVRAKLLSTDDHVGMVAIDSIGASLASGDNPVGRVTVSSIIYLASGNNPIGQVIISSVPFLASGDRPIGQVTIASMPPVSLSSATVSIGQVVVSSTPYLASGNEPIGRIGLLSGDQQIGQVTISSMPAVSLASATVSIGQVVVSSTPYLASGNEPIGRIGLLSGDQPIGQVIVTSMPSAGTTVITSMSNIASGDEPIGRVVVTSMPYLSSGDQAIGRVTVQSGSVVVTSGDMTITLLSSNYPIGQVVVSSFPFLSSGNNPIGQVTIASFLDGFNSGDRPIGRVTIQSYLGGLNSGDQPIGRVTIASFLDGFNSGDRPIGRVTIQSSSFIASGDNPIGRVVVTSLPFLASGNNPIGQVAIIGGDSRTMGWAPVSVTNSGVTTLVSGITSTRIVVRTVAIVCSGNVTTNWASSSTDISGPMPWTVNNGYQCHDPEGIFRTGIGESLDIKLDAAVPIGGHLTYMQI